MEIWVIAVFFIGYFFITIEHQVKIDKTISALGMASVCWALLKWLDLPVFEIENQMLHPLNPDNNSVAIDDILLHHLGKIAEILFFLIGAMTIVEVIDMHRGFEIIKKNNQNSEKEETSLDFRYHRLLFVSFD